MSTGKSLADILYYRTCITPSTFTEDGRSITFIKGRRYFTTRAKQGLLTVLSTYWCHGIPANIFGRPEKYSKGKK